MIAGLALLHRTRLLVLQEHILVLVKETAQHALVLMLAQLLIQLKDKTV